MGKMFTRLGPGSNQMRNLEKSKGLWNFIELDLGKPFL